MFDHYANVIDELVGQVAEPVEDQIREARATVARLRKEALDELMSILLDAKTSRQLGPGNDPDDPPQPRSQVNLDEARP